MKRFHLATLAPALASALLLAACGGGGGGGSPAGAMPTGTANVQLTDGPGDEFQHVWVSVRAIAFHSSADQVWSAADATWITTTLPAPVTIDLTTLNNGVLDGTLFAGLNLPAGTYRQIRFFFDGAEAPLDASALATMDSNGAALQWNDQVEYLNGTATPQESPLEIAFPTQGIQLLGTFNVVAGATLNLAVDFDLEHIIVPFDHDGQTYFTMRPNLAYFDMSQVGGDLRHGGREPAVPDARRRGFPVAGVRLQPHRQGRAAAARRQPACGRARDHGRSAYRQFHAVSAGDARRDRQCDRRL